MIFLNSKVCFYFAFVNFGKTNMNSKNPPTALRILNVTAKPVNTPKNCIENFFYF